MTRMELVAEQANALRDEVEAMSDVELEKAYRFARGERALWAQRERGRRMERRGEDGIRERIIQTSPLTSPKVPLDELQQRRYRLRATREAYRHLGYNAACELHELNPDCPFAAWAFGVHEQRAAEVALVHGLFAAARELRSEGAPER